MGSLILILVAKFIVAFAVGAAVGAFLVWANNASHNEFGLAWIISTLVWLLVGIAVILIWLFVDNPAAFTVQKYLFYTLWTGVTVGGACVLCSQKS